MGYTVGESSEKAEDLYLQQIRSRLGISIKNGVAVETETPLEVPPFSRAEFTMVAPPLTPPDYILRKLTPKDLPQFTAAVRAALNEWANDMGDLDVLIPYYGPLDPSVSVFVRSDKQQGSTEFLQRGNGIWDWQEKLWRDDHIKAHIDKQILSHELCRMRITGKGGE